MDDNQKKMFFTDDNSNVDSSKLDISVVSNDITDRNGSSHKYSLPRMHTRFNRCFKVNHEIADFLELKELM